MHEVPTDTVDRPIADTLPLQPNTPAPIAHVPQEPFAIPQGADMSWLTARTVVIGIGVVVLGAILVTGFRSSATPETIKVAPIQNTEPSSADVNKLVLENSKATLADLKIATDLKIEEVQQASINERSQEILLESQKHVSNPKSGCYRSPYGTACYITSFISEQQQRYADAISLRQWNKANNALFDVRAARASLDGVKQVPFTPAVTSAAIIKENQARINFAQQSDNAIAADLYGVKSKK